MKFNNLEKINFDGLQENKGCAMNFSGLEKTISSSLHEKNVVKFSGFKKMKFNSLWEKKG